VTITRALEEPAMKPTPRTPAPVLALLVAAVALALTCTEAPDQDTATERNVSMIRDYVDAWNRGDASYLDRYLAPTYVHHGGRGELDRDGFKKLHATMLTAFPGATAAIDDIIAQGDEVATRWTVRGRQDGTFRGIAPTGKEVTIHGIIISRFEDGRVVEEWEQADVAPVMQELAGAAAEIGPEH
jgi:steroid delta-isomerase-like uncharacterized protein